MDKGPRYRDTVLPFSLQPTSGSLVTSTLAPAPELDETEEHGAESPSKAEDDTSSSLQPRLLRKKRKETVHPSQDVTDVKANPNVGPPNRTTKAATESEVWQKYRRFWESDQAGKGIVAHDNSIEHNIVVIKKFKMHASRSQHEQLLRVMGDKHPNIVRLQDVFVCDLSVYSVYESLESSLHHIQATCLQEITEIELAIIAKEVSHLLTAKEDWLTDCRFCKGYSISIMSLTLCMGSFVPGMFSFRSMTVVLSWVSYFFI